MQLVEVRPGHFLDAEVVPSFLAWDAEVRRRIGGPPEYTEMYRSPAEQDRLYAGWIARKRGFNPAYKSTDKRARHIKGRAIDWGFKGRQAARATANQFGWDFNVSGEPWHAEFIKHVPLPAAFTPPTPSIETETDMLRMYRRKATGLVAAVNIATRYYWEVPSPGYVTLLKARKWAYNEDVIDLDDNEWDFMRKNLLGHKY